MTTIGLTAKVEPSVNKSSAKREASRLRSRTEDAMQDIEAHMKWQNLQEQVDRAAEAMPDQSEDSIASTSTPDTGTGDDLSEYGGGMSGRMLQKLDKQTKTQIKSLAHVKSVSGALSKLGSAFLKHGGKVAMAGLGLIMLSRISDSVSNASPLLGQLLDVFSLAMTMFFMPFGNIIGRLLMPLISGILQLSTDFNRFMFEAIDQGVRDGSLMIIAGLGAIIRENSWSVTQIGALLGSLVFLRRRLPQVISRIVPQITGWFSRALSPIISRVMGGAVGRMISAFRGLIVAGLRRVGLGGLARVGSRALPALVPGVGWLVSIALWLDLLFELLFGWSPIFDKLLPGIWEGILDLVDWFMRLGSSGMAALGAIPGILLMLWEWFVDVMGGLFTRMVELLEKLPTSSEDLLEGGADLWDWLSDGSADLWDWLADEGNHLWNWVAGSGNQLWSWATGEGNRLWDWAVGQGNRLWDWVAGKGSRLWNWVAGGGERLWDWVAGSGERLWDWVAGSGNRLWNWVAGRGSRLWDWVAGQANQLWGWITGGASNATQKFWDWLTGGAVQIGNWFEDNVVDRLPGHEDIPSTSEIVSGVSSRVERHIDDLVDRLPSGSDLDPRGASVGFDDVRGAVPLASGGIVTGPTSAIIGEGGEPEVVLPLSRIPSFINDVTAESSARSNAPDIEIEASPSVSTELSVDVAQEIKSELGGEFNDLKKEMRQVVSAIDGIELGDIQITADNKVLAEINSKGKDKYKYSREVTR